MTTSHHPLARKSKVALWLAGSAALFVGFQLQQQLPFNLSGSTKNPVAQTVATVSRLPFSFDQVVGYFSEALGQTPAQRSVNYARFTGGSEREGLFSLVLERHDAEISVRFQVIDDYGMNVVREFLEAPFFYRHESEQLYGLFYAGEGVHSATLQRFNVVFDYETKPEETLVSLLFSAPLQSRKMPHL